jgi:hypothetical protein
MSNSRKPICLSVFIVLAVSLSAAQILTGAELKKAVPSSYFYAGQSAPVQMRNSVGVKNSAGKLVLGGLVDTSGYATAIAEKYQGFLITEAKISIEGSPLEVGAYGFGFSKDGKFNVMNVAGTDVLSVSSKNDEARDHPVPLKVEKDGSDYRLYGGKKYVALKVD